MAEVAGTSDRSILQRLVGIFEELTEIKVVTAVEDVTVRLTQKNGRTKTEFDPAAEPINRAIVTIFDLVDGDVTNIISPELKDDEAIRSFHAAQVEKSLTVLPENISALVKFGQALIQEIRQ